MYLLDVLHQHADNLETYEEVRDISKGTVNNRIARNVPIPMNIGEVKNNCEHGWEDCSGKDVGAVSTNT